MKVVGVDGYRKGWVAVVLDRGGFAESAVFRRLTHVLDRYSDAVSVGVDIPIGLPEAPVRAADAEAARFLGRAAQTVFPTYPRAFYEHPSRADAFRLCGEQGWVWHPFSYGLGRKILEVEDERDSRVFEVHPEVSFAELAKSPIVFSKQTWTGFMLRRRLLARAGIDLPDELGDAPLIDVLDAAAAAWSAARYARGEARPLPEATGQGIGAIWR